MRLVSARIAAAVVWTASAREVLNFDFAWRVQSEAAPTRFGDCGVSLVKENGERTCIQNISFGCWGDHAVEVQGGCSGDFICGGATVSCSSGINKGGRCSCDGSDVPSGPPDLLPPAAVISSDFDDSSWEIVDAPHDFLITGSHSEGNHGTQGWQPRGKAWYRKHFVMPQEWAKDTSVALYIEGAFHKTSLYLNGQKLGEEHVQGYTSFWRRLDDVEGIVWGGENVLVAHVDASSGTGWWYEGGGLARHNFLIATKHVHILPDRSWVFANVTGAQIGASCEDQLGCLAASDGAFQVQTEVVNDGKVDVAVSMVARVYSDDGALVAQSQSESEVQLSSGTSRVLLLSAAAKNIELWSVRRPYLYTTSVAILVDGELADEVNVTSGARKIEFDPDHGLLLNSEHVKMRGFCDHANFGGVGAAVPDRVNLFRAQMIRAVGGNAWRMTHNAPVPLRLDLMDRLGLMAMDENRDYGGHEQQGGFTDETIAEELVDMADMVRRDRNHPSIVLWSFCNEEGCKNESAAEAFRQVVYEFDGTRPVTQNRLGSSTSSDFLDVQGFSHKQGSDFDTFHEAHPEKPMLATECCSCMSQRGVDTDYCPNPRPESCKEGCVGGCNGDGSDGVFYNNEISQCTADQIARSDYLRDDVAGTFVWSGFDYLGESRGWPQPVKCRGTIGDVAGFTKETAWWLRSWWLTNISGTDAGRPPIGSISEPTVRIIDAWTAPRAGVQNRTLHVFSDAPSVELSVNGRSADRQDVPFFGTATFSVAFEEGEVRATARGHGGESLGSHAIRNSGEAYMLQLSVDAPSPRTGTGSALVLDGNDVAMLGARILDAQGELATNANQAVTFTVVSGPGRLIGTHSGDPASQEPALSASSTAYHGLTRAYVRAAEDSATSAAHRSRLLEVDLDGGKLTRIVQPSAKRAPASITVRAEAPGLVPAEIQIPTTQDLDQLPLNVALRSYAVPLILGDDPALQGSLLSI